MACRNRPQFHCAGDEKLYLDLRVQSRFRNALSRSGRFCLCYVIAYQAGHHVQKSPAFQKKGRGARARFRGRIRSDFRAYGVEADRLRGRCGDTTRAP
ncbi:MAG: neutral zinc metallopeptidase [Candidatus Competibacteraceae bacterium]|nr:neutral zinc metallopeptidase [Candidatus Competibacteraceae bacterium]